MTDFFALLGLPARPSVDETFLKERYFELASLWHPDSPEGDAEKFNDLQEALKTLRSPSERLRHLIEVRFPDAGTGLGQFGNSGLFMMVGSALQRGRVAFNKRANAKSALARAVLAEEVVSSLKAMVEAREAVDASRKELQQKVVEFDVAWPEVSPEDLSALAGQFTYLTRWREELAEWEFKLAQD